MLLISFQILIFFIEGRNFIGGSISSNEESYHIFSVITLKKPTYYEYVYKKTTEEHNVAVIFKDILFNQLSHFLCMQEFNNIISNETPKTLIKTKT